MTFSRQLRVMVVVGERARQGQMCLWRTSPLAIRRLLTLLSQPHSGGAVLSRPQPPISFCLPPP
jgi:hypothetical protein